MEGQSGSLSYSTQQSLENSGEKGTERHKEKYLNRKEIQLS